MAEVAESLGIGKDLIYRWRRQMRERGENAFPGNRKIALTSEQKKIQELEKKLKDTEMERDSLKKAIVDSIGHLQQDIEMKYVFIENNRSTFPVKKMCQAFEISPSGYYRWRRAPLSNREIKNLALIKRIRELLSQHKGMVGSPIITADLREESRFSDVSRPRVARLMKEMGLKCKAVKKFVVTTDSKHREPVSPSPLDRHFSVAAPDQVYVTDITYLKVGKKWNYLTVFIDLFSRHVVGWDLSDTLERFSAIKALNKAILRRRSGQGLMVHSDRGIQYASKDFRKLLVKHGFIQSMSRKGNCWIMALLNNFSER